MKQPPSSSEQQQRRFTSSVSPPWSIWFKQLGLLILGVGIGAIGVKWLAPESRPSTDLSSRALEVEAAPEQTGRANSESSSRPTRALPTKGDVADATVCVKTLGPNGGEACASGVAIDPQLVGLDPQQGSVVLTNFHVVAEPIAGLPMQLGGKGTVFNAELIKQSPETDLALLFVPEAKFPVAALSEVSPEAGVAVRAIGFPNDQPLTIKNSTLLGQTRNCLALSPCLAMQQGTITHGNSGGPLEANGQVIGITQGETSEEIAIPIEQVHQFLSGQLPNTADRSPQFDRRFRTNEPYPYSDRPYFDRPYSDHPYSDHPYSDRPYPFPPAIDDPRFHPDFPPPNFPPYQPWL